MRNLLFLLIISLFLLSACGGQKSAEVDNVEEKNNNMSSKQEEKGNEKEIVSDTEEEENKEEAEEEFSDELVNVGDKIKDKELQGIVELLGIAEPNETIELGSVNILIESIKLLKLYDVKNQEFQNLFKMFTDEKDFSYVQIMYKIENTEDVNVHLNAPIDTIVLNTGEQIDIYSSDIAFDDNAGKTLYGKVKNESLVALIIKDSKPEDIEEIKVVFGTIFSENYDIIADNETKVYKINK